MIDLPLEECYAFDFLSILFVKLENCPREKKAAAAKMSKFYSERLTEQVGDIKYNAVINSIEFKKLQDCNKDIFNLINHAVNYSVEYRVGCRLNYRRWELKNALQKKFFGRAAAEQKIGGFINPD